MAWTIEFDPKADKELKKLGSDNAKRILAFLFGRLAMSDNLRAFGEALTGAEFGEFWKYRVGDYRVVCEIRDQSLTVMVLKVGHRREVYR